MKLNKKIFAVLMAITMVFVLTACPADSGGGNDTLATTTAGDAVATGDGDATGDDTPSTTAGGTTTPAGPGHNFPTDAQDFDFVVMQFNCREFNIRDSGRMMLGDNMDSKRNDAKDAVRSAFQQENDFDENSEFIDYRFLITQNGEFWSSVSHITATFYLEFIECVDDPSMTAEEAAIDIGFMQEYVQLGGLTGSDGWYFNSDRTKENVVQQYDEWGFGSDYVMEIIWDIGLEMDEHGTLDIADKDVEIGGQSRGGGVLKFGIQIGNDGIDEYRLKICWTSVEVFVRDMDLFNQYVDAVSAVNGAVFSDNVKITAV
ncbi:MAG: hypothetical protein FWD34_01025 [Oscillospiraceae bacterium]|nr:hypothetical protein [Oscillospiraceae bacterium]